jgi:poly-gamma-glutamate capsule biosynthesis protein CapA/YwtB (metallophosphatase superfamily)
MRRRVTRALVAVTALTVGLAAGCTQLPSAQPTPTPAGLDATGLPPRPDIPSWTPHQAPPAGFTVVATGDVLIHPALTAQASADGGGKPDFRPLFAGVRPVISEADLAICHLEVPLATAAGPFRGWPEFYAPPEVATALADTGYDECSTASNHTLDQGATGVRTTLDALDAAGIKHTGSARTAQEAREPRILEAGGAKVGHVSFTFGFNGAGPPSSAAWLANTLDVDAVVTAAAAAKKSGADVVIASLHWGNELQSRPTAQQREIARRLLADESVDLIVGHHAHVVQPFEQINGKWVAYGLGNHVARHADPQGTTEEGVVARFRFGKDASGKWHVEQADYVPTLVDLGPPIRLIDLTAVRNSDRKAQALQRIEQVLLSRGAKLNRVGG